jgi:hypothetical protein
MLEKAEKNPNLLNENPAWEEKVNKKARLYQRRTESRQ